MTARSTMLNIAAAPPIPSESESSAMAVKPGEEASVRMAKRASRKTLSRTAPARASPPRSLPCSARRGARGLAGSQAAVLFCLRQQVQVAADLVVEIPLRAIPAEKVSDQA